MKKAEIIEALANKTGLTKADVTRVYESTFELFKEELGKGNDVAVAGFGTFKVSERAARTCRNPKTGDPIQVEACKAVSFKFGKDLKETVNN